MIPHAYDLAHTQARIRAYYTHRMGIPMIAAILACSRQDVYRMLDAHHTPSPAQAARLRAWDRAIQHYPIHAWIYIHRLCQRVNPHTRTSLWTLIHATRRCHPSIQAHLDWLHPHIIQASRPAHMTAKTSPAGHLTITCTTHT